MTDQEIYQKLIDYIKNPVAGFPESEHMMPMITSFITPEEAEFLTGSPTSDAILDQIAAMKEMDPAELAPKIEALCRKGLVYEAIDGDSSRYRARPGGVELSCTSVSTAASPSVGPVGCWGRHGPAGVAKG